MYPEPIPYHHFRGAQTIVRLEWNCVFQLCIRRLVTDPDIDVHLLAMRAKKGMLKTMDKDELATIRVENPRPKKRVRNKSKNLIEIVAEHADDDVA